MSRQRSKIHWELKSICRYRSLVISRTVLLILMVLLFFPLRPVPAYLILILFVFPSAINYLINSSHPDKNEQILSNSVLTETMKSHNFVYSKFRSEVINYYFTVFVLIVWQIFQERITWYNIPIWVLPSFILVIYIITERTIFLYHYLHMHYDFTHINIK